MKKILLFLTFVAVVFASCDPLSQTYKGLDATPQKKIAISVATAYATPTAAIAAIPAILSASYGQYSDGSTAIVTYSLSPNAVLAPDVTLSHLTYTMTTPDYTFPGNTFTDLSSTAVLNFLAYKYPNAVPYQLSVLTYNYFETGYAGSSGTITTDVFMFVNGAWLKTYALTPSQYALVGRGLTNTFGSTDLANIPSYLNSILKADPTVSLTAKAGDIKYVSYKYNNGTLQEAVPMVFDGTNWASRLTAPFIKTNGTWILNPAINYTFVAADYVTVMNSTVGNATNRGNLSHGNFNVKATDPTGWSTTDLDAAISLILTAKFPAPKVAQEYDVTYATYQGPASGFDTRVYVWSGSAFVSQQP